MMYFEFQEKLGDLQNQGLLMHRFPTYGEYAAIIEPVYAHHPMFDHHPDQKTQVAMLYAAGGLSLMKRLQTEVDRLMRSKTKEEYDYMLSLYDGKEDHDGDRQV